MSAEIERGAGEAVVIGGERRVPALQLDFHTGQRIAGAQVGGPHRHIAIVGDHVDADIGVLHPGHRRRAGRDLCNLASPVDNHDQMTVLAVEGTGEIYGNLGEGVMVDTGVDDLVDCHRPRNIHHIPVPAPSPARHKIQERPIVTRLHGIEAHTKLLPLAHHDRNRLLHTERINGGEQPSHEAEVREGFVDAELNGLGLFQGLTEHVAQPFGDHHFIDGAAGRGPGDGHGAAVYRDGGAGEFWRYGDVGRIERLSIQRVVEPNGERTPRPAPLI